MVSAAALTVRDLGMIMNCLRTTEKMCDMIIHDMSVMRMYRGMHLAVCDQTVMQAEQISWRGEIGILVIPRMVAEPQ